MSIQILPARLANQIAAGEVVERPASVVKELVENSLDAGATKIVIDIDKGGAKRIRIADNGKGIVKDELTLALSRHATSKIKDLTDLEAIASLGFRGEALASISSVARLTLTSKPLDQESAWQAYAQGRDMEVTIQPAAHPNGTTIEVNDLFFNTPARRKFLRTEKTEFSHIDEVVRRIALARFDVSFVLTHNGKMVRHYRIVNDEKQFTKRVAQVCSQKFVDNALQVDCQHDGVHLWGWIAKPDFFRTQNDLCYSYVNGRMMRDKLINHGIRQAYADLIPSEGYPAFVLYLELDHKEVDVNVHPAKHEVRFHQGRYIHDFIYSVCHQALQTELASAPLFEEGATGFENSATMASVNYPEQDYIRPLQKVAESKPAAGYHQPNMRPERAASDIAIAASSYQSLMSTPSVSEQHHQDNNDNELNSATDKITNYGELIHIVEGKYGVWRCNEALKLINLSAIAGEINLALIEQRWAQGLVSQPLLLPIQLSLEKEQVGWLNRNIAMFEQAGIVLQIQGSGKVQVRQFPSMLRAFDVSSTLQQIVDGCTAIENAERSPVETLKSVMAALTITVFDLASAQQLWRQGQTVLAEQLITLSHLNSVSIDLTSAISELN